MRGLAREKERKERTGLGQNIKIWKEKMDKGDG